VTRQEAQELLARLVPLDNLVGDVGPVKRRREDARRAERQLVDDVLASVRISGRRQRHARHTGIGFPKMPEFAVLGPEIMPPLRNAMGFIYGKKGDLGGADHLSETRRDDPLGGHIEKIKLAPGNRRADIQELIARQRGIESCCTHAQLLERLHLVTHQRDQRRHDDTHPVPAQRRDLEAQRLSGPVGNSTTASPPETTCSITSACRPRKASYP
jgi:hypothetical protein